MPFQKGVATPGAGRKSMQIEQAQLEKMRKVLSKDLAITEKLQNKKDIDPVEKEKLAILQARVLKIYDKLHVTKTDLTSNGKTIVINVAPEIAEQNEINPSPKNNSTRSS